MLKSQTINLSVIFFVHNHINTIGGVYMVVAAYCRVSTGSEEQLNSLKNQSEFFKSYAQKNNYELYKIFADRGISGKSYKNRPEYLSMLESAGKKEFDMLLVKDISRFARNTVDFLNGIRLLKSKGIEIRFLSANQTVLGESEFVLTMFAALAQEESYNLSKRIIFGKKSGAKQGRTPCCVYGYKYENKYNLVKDSFESEIVKEIFDLYSDGFGLRKISQYLTDKNVPTKRCGKWQFKTIRRILSNRIYIREIINNKSTTDDFLSGTRKKVDENEWIIHYNENLRIVSDEQFQVVQNKLLSNAVKHRSS